MPSPRLLTAALAALATALAAVALSLTLQRVLAAGGIWWEWTNELRGVNVPLALTALFAAALLAAWTRRATTFAILAVAPALTQIVRLATTWGYPGATHVQARLLYRAPLGDVNLAASDGGPTWAEMTAMAAIGVGLAAAMVGVLTSDTRDRPRLLLIALPVLMGGAIVAKDAADSLSPLNRETGWWGMWQHAATALVVLVIGGVLLLLARVRRLPHRPAAIVQSVGALLLLVPLAQELWDYRPMSLRRLMGDLPGTGGWLTSEGFVRGRGDAVGAVLESLGATVLQLTIVLAALAALTCLWPERKPEQ